jgi:hypothetical protein
MHTKYKNLKKKLQKLQDQTTRPHKNPENSSNNTNTFYPRTINLTNTIFTNEETQLLNKGLSITYIININTG